MSTVAAPLPRQAPLADFISIGAGFRRSVNIERDSDAIDLVRAYRPTSRAMAALEQLADGLNGQSAALALALIGPYGTGKSAFALFVSALLASPDNPARPLAQANLKANAPALALRLSAPLGDSRGLLRIQVNAIPDSLTRQLLRACANAAAREQLPAPLIKRMESGARAQTRPVPRMDRVLALLGELKQAWTDAGSGVQLLKTIGLLNLIGAQRGLKSSERVLRLLFGESLDAPLAALQAASIIHFRGFSGEYRVWQGSDFDLRAALERATAEQSSRALADLLNSLNPLPPMVARRASIETGTLRSFRVRFTSAERWPPEATEDELTLWLYLAEPAENVRLDGAPELAVIAVCRSTEHLRERVAEWQALIELPRLHAELQQDPVAMREHLAWLENAEFAQHCDEHPAEAGAAMTATVEPFIARLIAVLRELNGAYPALLAHWHRRLAQSLLQQQTPRDLADTRAALARRYRGLDRYAAQQGNAGAFLRWLCDTGHQPDPTAWLESLMTLLAKVPPAKWRESHRVNAELRLEDMAGQIADLESLCQSLPNSQGRPADEDDSFMLKLIRPGQEERRQRGSPAQLT